MPYYNKGQRQASAAIMLGAKVSRAASTHTGGAVSLFTVAGGRVLMTALVGQVTVATTQATTAVLTHVPTTGTTQPIAASLDLDPALVGDQLTITGLATDAMTYNASAAGLRISHKVVLPIGAVTLTTGAAEGATSWDIWYIPLDEGASVSAA